MARLYDFDLSTIVDSKGLNRVIAARPIGAADLEWDNFWNPPTEQPLAQNVGQAEDVEIQVTRSCTAPLRLAPQTAIPKIKFRDLKSKGLIDSDGWPKRQLDFFGFDVAKLRNPVLTTLANFDLNDVVHVSVPFNSKLKTRHGNAFKSFTDLGVPTSVKVANLHHVMRDVNDLSIQSLSIASTLGVFSHTLVPWALFQTTTGEQTLGKTERGRLRSKFPRQLAALQEAWKQTSLIPVARHHCDAVLKCILKLCPRRLAGIKVWGSLSPASVPIPFLRAGKTNSAADARPFGAVPDLLLYDSVNAKVFAIEIKTQYSSAERGNGVLREQLRQCALQALATSFCVTRPVTIVPVLVCSQIGLDVADGQTVRMYTGAPIPSFQSQETKNILADAILFSQCSVSDESGNAYKGSLPALAKKLRGGGNLAAKVRYITQVLD